MVVAASLDFLKVVSTGCLKKVVFECCHVELWHLSLDNVTNIIHVLGFEEAGRVFVVCPYSYLFVRV